MATKRKNALDRARARGLEVSPEEARQFPFDHKDILIAEVMMAGKQSHAAIAEEIGISKSAVQQRLLDPVRCAWISQQIREAVHTRLGNVLGAVYSRAIATGDPRAASLLLKQYGEMVDKPQRHEHVHMAVDLTGVGNDELKQMIDERMRGLGMRDGKVKDAEFTQPAESDDGSRAEGGGEAASGQGAGDGRDQEDSGAAGAS